MLKPTLTAGPMMFACPTSNQKKAAAQSTVSDG